MKRPGTFTLAVLMPLLLTAAAGCVYIPARDTPARPGGPDPGRLVGVSASEEDKPLRPGAATREHVAELLGPAAVWPGTEPPSWVYHFKMKAGYWLFIVVPVLRADRYVAVRFDFADDGVVREVEVDRGGHSPIHILGPIPPRPRMLLELSEAQVREERQRKMSRRVDGGGPP